MKIKDISRIKGREVITVKPHTTLSEAIKKLVNNKIGALPVCDFKGTLLGILSERVDCTPMSGQIGLGGSGWAGSYSAE
jgi:CBS domain-containing protein